MVNLRELLATAGHGSLVLIDEIAVGTDPEQGAALAQAVLEALAGRGVTAIVTTHYERLKALGATDPRFANASVGFDLARLEPTFKLHLGAPGSSGALAVAPPHGHRRRRRRSRPRPDGPARRQGRGAARERRRSAAADRGGARRAPRRARGRRGRSRGDAPPQGQAARALREADPRRARRGARRAQGRPPRDRRPPPRGQGARRGGDAATLDDVKAATRRLVAPGAIVARLEPQRQMPPGTPARPEQLVAGAPVIVPRLGRAEVVAVLPDDRVEVRVGAMRATVPIKDVLLDTHRNARRAGLGSRPEPGEPSFPGSSSPVFGLDHGHRCPARRRRAGRRPGQRAHRRHDARRPRQPRRRRRRPGRPLRRREPDGRARRDLRRPRPRHRRPALGDPHATSRPTRASRSCAPASRPRAATASPSHSCATDPRGELHAR